MQEFLGLAVYAFIFLAVAVGVLLYRDHKDGALKRYLTILEHLHESIVGWVERADHDYDQILIDYADKALETGKDARLLWVIDQVEAYVKRRFKLDIDIDWVINQVEAIVRSRKS